MTHITLSIPNIIYQLMKRYREVNWSEVARRAIIQKILGLKALREGLTREELLLLLNAMGKEVAVKSYDYDIEMKYLRMVEEREKRRMKLLSDLEER